MGWFFRKSVGFGPIRLSFSKRGVGVSTGVRGFRIGVDARGQSYVTAGRGGIYYRQRLGAVGARGVQPSLSQPVVAPATTTHGPLISHGSGQQILADDELTLAVRAAAGTKRLLPLAVVVAVVTGVAGTLLAIDRFSASPQSVSMILQGILAILCIVLGVCLTMYAAIRDKQKILHLDYAMDNESRHAWDALLEAVSRLQHATCKVRRAQADVFDPKYHAGASAVVDTKPLRVFSNRPIPFVDAGIRIPAIEPADGIVYRFLPDRIVSS